MTGGLLGAYPQPSQGLGALVRQPQTVGDGRLVFVPQLLYQGGAGVRPFSKVRTQLRD